MKRRLIAALLVLMAALPTSRVSADEQQRAIVVPVVEGEPAPFSGTLLSPRAAAELMARKEASDAERTATVVAIVASERVRCDLALEELRISHKAITSVSEAAIAARDAELDALASNRPNRTTWMALGASAGIVVTVVLASLLR